MIKIDVDGAESDVISGARVLISVFRPIIYFECWSKRNFVKIADHLLGLDYKLYWHPAPLFRPDNHFRNLRDRYHGQGINANVLAVQAGRLIRNDLYPVQRSDDFWPVDTFQPHLRRKIVEWSRRP